MRARGWWAVGLALGVMLGGAALAQQERGFVRFAGGAMLLQRPEVQAELKLTEEQKTQISALLQKQREELQSRLQEIIAASPEQRQKMMAEMQAENRKRLNAILTPDQQKRYKQITLQQQGFSALATPEIADEMKLTDEQKKKVGELMEQQNAAMREAAQNAAGDRQAVLSKLQSLRQETNTRIEALLTDEQKSHWKEMLGTPLKLETPGG